MAGRGGTPARATSAPPSSSPHPRPSEALSLSSRIAIFDHGRLLADRCARDIYERPESRFVAEFLGEINLLPVERVGHCSARHQSACSRARGCARRATTMSMAAPCAAVRPEHMSVPSPRAGAGRQRRAGPADGHDLSRRRRAPVLTTRSGTRLTVTLPSEVAGPRSRSRAGPLGHPVLRQWIPSSRAKLNRGARRGRRIPERLPRHSRGQGGLGEISRRC